jgi:hypothetical protein
MKTAYHRIFSLVSGLLIVALVLLTQSWAQRPQGQPADEATSTEESVPSLSAPAEALPVYSLLGITACFALIAELTVEEDRSEQLPATEHFPAVRFLRTLVRAFVSPNAP